MKKPNMKVIDREAKQMTVRLKDSEGNVVNEATHHTFLSPSEMAHEVAVNLEHTPDLLNKTAKIEVLI